MSSSKIQSYNLDDSVFDGIAMQSTSEEILEKVNDVYGASVEWQLTKTVSGNLTTSEKEVLSVQGSGALHTFSQLHTEGTSTVKIVVDGKTIVNGKMTSNNSSYPVLLHVGNPSDVKFIADGSNTRSGACSPVLKGTFGTAYGLYVGGAKGLSEEQWEYSNNGVVLFVPLVNAITFEESLVITCKGSTSGDQYGCLYELR